MRRLLLAIMLLSCLTGATAKIRTGVYRGVLTLDPTQGVELPFNFEVVYRSKKPLIIIRNADERIEVDEITIKGDSVNFRMPVFDTEFRTVRKGNNLEGIWINHYRTNKNIIPFRAEFGEKHRFLNESPNVDANVHGRWEVTFSPSNRDSSKAVGIFEHIEQTAFIKATFLTETGDYRYLEGMMNRRALQLSCFDGGRAFLFTAETNEKHDKLSGKFYSGAHWKEDWTAKRNDRFNLRSPYEITSVKPDNSAISFKYPDTEGQAVSLEDDRFVGKAVIIQLMGSWCPNCMDESLLIAELLDKYNAQGLEAVALAFEKTTDVARATSQVKRMKERLKLQYPVLITGVSGKEQATKAMPMLNEVIAFPTTIFLDRNHKVVKVHTGFSGPATGREYEKLKENIELTVHNLLKS
jgi:thiol-disulfide isomerase/thioredoxin